MALEKSRVSELVSLATFSHQLFALAFYYAKKELSLSNKRLSKELGGDSSIPSSIVQRYRFALETGIIINGHHLITDVSHPLVY